MPSLKRTNLVVMSTVDTRTRRILDDTPNFPGATEVTGPGDSFARRLCLLHIESLILLQSGSLKTKDQVGYVKAKFTQLPLRDWKSEIRQSVPMGSADSSPQN